jgi:tetratricopeptide (TPR) repeat protein
MPTEPPSGKPDALLAYQEALRRGHQALLGGNARQALAEYESAIAVAGDRALPHLSAGRALLALNRAADALAAFERAHERSPSDTGALQGKAEALTRLGRAREAAEVAAEIERLISGARPATAGATTGAETDLPESALPRAEVLMGAAERAWLDGRVDTAVGQWLAAARFHAADGHLDAALEACQRALLAEPGGPRVHLELSRLYVARGWREQAAERMELLSRLVELDGLNDVRAELAELARDTADHDPRIAALASRLGDGSLG